MDYRLDLSPDSERGMVERRKRIQTGWPWKHETSYEYQCRLSSQLYIPVTHRPFGGLYRASLVAQMVKILPVMQETQVRSLGREDSLEKGMAIHSSILAWRIPWTQDPGGLQSMGSQIVRHNRLTNTYTHNILSQFSVWSLYSSLHPKHSPASHWHLINTVFLTPPSAQEWTYRRQPEFLKWQVLFSILHQKDQQGFSWHSLYALWQQLCPPAQENWAWTQTLCLLLTLCVSGKVT